jgi:hypothetical protein
MRLAVLVVILAACGSSSPGGGDDDDDAPPGDDAVADAALVDGPPHVPGNPGPGAHGLAYFRLESHGPTLSAPAMDTHASGGTILVSVGRGDANAFVAPTDNHDNVYALQGSAHAYTNWPTSGTALYIAAGASGGVGHVVSNEVPETDEVTLAAVEVFDGATIADVTWHEVLAPNALTAEAVTTTGPATLVAFWWGDAGVDGDKTATPDNGFTVVEAILQEGALVQCAVAVREVAEAGTYDVTWTATPQQGAQLYLVAIQE